MALTEEIERKSQNTIAQTRRLLAYVQRLDTSSRELSPEKLVQLTRIIGEHALKINALSTSIRTSAKCVQRRKTVSPSRPQWPVAPEMEVRRA